jgi:hypothetical protein
VAIEDAIEYFSEKYSSIESTRDVYEVVDEKLIDYVDDLIWFEFFSFKLLFIV